MTAANLSLKARLRALLVLGRVSNLPTVWSNCVAAWVLAGSGKPKKFAFLCTGATLLYTGGMFLNDAFDIEFDRQYRPERPIIAGQISARAVWLFAAALLSLGWVSMFPLGKLTLLASSMLVATIIIYDAVHKHTKLAPLLMAACRFLLYVAAGSAALRGVGPAVVLRASALAAYIVGLSYLARNESTGSVANRWSTPFLFVPIAVALIGPKLDEPMVWIAAVAQAAWVLWCLLARGSGSHPFFRRGVPGLLAGIVLVDWLAVAGSAFWLSGAFLSLFFLALLTQRFAPAT